MSRTLDRPDLTVCGPRTYRLCTRPFSCWDTDSGEKATDRRLASTARDAATVHAFSGTIPDRTAGIGVSVRDPLEPDRIYRFFVRMD